MSRYYKYFGGFNIFCYLYAIVYYFDKGSFDFFFPAFVMTMIILLEYRKDRRDRKNKKKE